MAGPMDIAEIKRIVVSKYGINLREFQARAVQLVFQPKDVFVAVPTGTGKTLCYSVLPGVADAVGHPTSPKSMVVVVSPLLSLMEDQANQISAMGIPTTYLGSSQSDPSVAGQVLEGKWQVLLVSPELALSKFRNLLLKIKSKVVAVVIDEAHCIASWGLEFRPEFQKLMRLRALARMPYMALTATGTTQIRHDVMQSLAMDDAITIYIEPNRPNIHYRVVTIAGSPESHLERIFGPFVDMINSVDVTCPKVIVYCNAFSTVSSVYSFFHARVPDVASQLSPIAMYHSATDEENKCHVLSVFPKSDSVVRVVVCTVAFGLGINIPDVRHVINFGVPYTLEEFVQESGRAGRDGEFAESILYHSNALKGSETDDSMLRYCAQDISCRRQFLAQHFRLTEVEEFPPPEVKSTPHCCDLCSSA